MDFDKAVGSLKHAMTFMAIWPSTRQTVAQMIIWFFHVTGFFISVSVIYASSFVAHKDLERAVASLGQAVLASVIAVKYALFRTKMKPLKYVLKTMEEDWAIRGRDPEFRDEDGREYRRIKIMSIHARVPRIFFAIDITIVMLGWMLFIIAPTTAQDTSSDNNETSTISMKLPMNSWYPFPTHQSPIYQIIYVSESVVGTFMVIAHTSIDSFLVTIIFHLCGQLEILRVRIEKFQTKRSPQTMIDDIKYIVKRHETLIYIAGILEKSFNHILLGQLLGGTIDIGLAGFTFIEAMESYNPTAVVKFGMLLTMGLQQMFIYSFSGDYLTSQGAGIRMAVYKANWYELPPSINKLFLLIMIRATEPITITAGKFYAMSLNNFTGLLKSAVSYLSLLRAMNTD